MAQWESSPRAEQAHKATRPMSYYVGVGTIAAAVVMVVSIAGINRAADIYAPLPANVTNFSAPSAPVPSAPAPKSASSERPVPADIQDAALRVLRSQGYVCNEVRSSFIWLSEPGFTLYCPRWKFLFYENGGRWRIEPKHN